MPAGKRGREFTLECASGTAVKDLIESQGVPHSEVDLVLVDGASVDLGHGLSDGERVSVFPVFESLNVESVTRVRS